MIKHRIVMSAAMVCALGLPIACSRSSETPKPAAAATPPEQVYTVRGQVAMLPEPGKPGSGFQVKHEPIDNFQRQDGTLGMDTMTMPFPLAPGVSIKDIAVGDPVELTFELRWKSQPHFQTVKVVKLPADTQLHFGKVTPAK